MDIFKSLVCKTVKHNYRFINDLDYYCRAITIKSMVFEIHVDTWVYSKDDTMAHAHRLVVTS